MIDRSIRRTGRKMSWSVRDDRPPQRYRPRSDMGVKMMKTWLPMSGMSDCRTWMYGEEDEVCVSMG